MALGSLLDNNLFHEVMISRERRDVILSVDRVRIRDRIRGDFHKLNLDRELYIGGVENVEDGLVVFENFTGKFFHKYVYINYCIFVSFIIIFICLTPKYQKNPHLQNEILG